MGKLLVTVWTCLINHLELSRAELEASVVPSVQPEQFDAFGNLMVSRARTKADFVVVSSARHPRRFSCSLKNS
jgi:hypothetical protein